METGRRLEDEMRAVVAFKKVALMVIGTAMQPSRKAHRQQELLSTRPTFSWTTYAAESAVLRAQDAIANGHKQAALHEAAARTFVNDAAQRVEMAARSALAGMAEGDTLRTLLAALRRVLKVQPVNTVVLRRRLADAALANGGYMLN